MSEVKRKKTCSKPDQDEEELESQDATNHAEGKFLPKRCEFNPDIIPAELWELIFKNVESPKDVLSCWNSNPCSAWAAALRSTEFYFKMTLPLMLPYLSRNDLLNCSAVSKSWNKSVDICMQSAEDFFSDHRLDRKQQIEFQIDHSDLTLIVNKFKLANNESRDKTFPVNPVAFRRVVVNLWFNQQWTEEDEPLSTYEKNLLKCLDHCGHLIYHFTVTIYDVANTSCLDKIKLIRNCLERTPNLRALKLSPLGSNDGDYDDNDQPIERSSEAFNAYISKNPWPSLRHLKVLKFFDYTCANQEEYASIANAYGPQLLYFKFCLPGWWEVEPLRLIPTRFSCLQKMVYVLLTQDSTSAFQFRAFIKSLQCPLKHLTIDIVVDDSEDEKYRDRLPLDITAASATLETLVFRTQKLCGTNVYNNMDINKYQEMRLPKLKVLDTFGYPSLQFLQNVCPALEQLTMKPLLAEDGGGRHVESGDVYIDLYSEHQFWSEMANIQRVDVEIMFPFEYRLVDGKREKFREMNPGGKVRKVYTRSGYQAKMENSKQR